MAVTADACLIAQRLRQRLPECDADILDGVMTVDMQIAPCLDRQIDRAMARDLLQHVVEKANASGELAGSATIEVDRYADLCFLGVALDLGTARIDGHGIHCPSDARNAFMKVSFSATVPTVTRRQPASSG